MDRIAILPSEMSLKDSYLICSCILDSNNCAILPTNVKTGRNIKYIQMTYLYYDLLYLMFLKELKRFHLLDTIACQIGAVIFKSG